MAEAVWEICKAHDKRGLLPSSYWQAEFLARWTQFDRERGGLPGIKKGMASALKSGLLEQHKDGTVEVHDWEQYQMDSRAARKKRKADPRKSRKLQGQDPGPSSAVQDDPVGPGTVQKDPVDRTEQDRTDPEHAHTPDNMIWMINQAFTAIHESRTGVLPSQPQNIQSKLEDIKRQFDHHRKPETTDAQYLAVVQAALVRYFDTAGDQDGNYRLWHFRDCLPAILQQMKEEAS